MTKKVFVSLAVWALCAALAFAPALAETRQGVIYLEGMEEAIEETFYVSPQGFSFWYASEGLKAEFGTVDDMEGAIVSSIYTGDYMVLSRISEEEALVCTKDLNVDIREQAAKERVQVEVYENMENFTVHFCTLIAENGNYLRAVGVYPMEAADGLAKYFQRVLDTVEFGDISTPDAQ